MSVHSIARIVLAPGKADLGKGRDEVGVVRKTQLTQDILQGHLARTTPDFPRAGDGTAWQLSWGQKKPKVGCALGSPQGGEIYWLDPWEMIFTLHLWKFYKIANSQISPCLSPSPSKPNFLGMGLGCGDGGFPS